LWREHADMIMNLAVRYAKRLGADIDTTVQAGRFGLWHAAQRFDPSKGVLFATYLEYWLRGYMLRWANEERAIIYVPKCAAARGVRIERVYLDPDPDADTDELDAALLEDLVTIEGPPADFDIYEALHTAMNELEPPLREVIDMYYYRGQSQEEIGGRLGIVRGSVRTRLAKALRILRQKLNEAELKATT
jgi:RNA polymerase sigma factor (sigma-70 family)